MVEEFRRQPWTRAARGTKPEAAPQCFYLALSALLLTSASLVRGDVDLEGLRRTASALADLWQSSSLPSLPRSCLVTGRPADSSEMWMLPPIGRSWHSISTPITQSLLPCTANGAEWDLHLGASSQDEPWDVDVLSTEGSTAYCAWHGITCCVAKDALHIAVARGSLLSIGSLGWTHVATVPERSNGASDLIAATEVPAQVCSNRDSTRGARCCPRLHGLGTLLVCCQRACRVQCMQSLPRWRDAIHRAADLCGL